jgi:ribonucleoside-diphosphate reductase alpha chain
MYSLLFKESDMTMRILDPIFHPPITDNGHYMLRFRYLKKTPDGGFEQPVEMFRRVALNLAEAEKVFDPKLTDEAYIQYANSFFELMTDFKFLPNAPTLLGAGRPLQQLSACFLLPVGDSIEDIFNTLRMAALVHSHGGGTGFSFSHLRSRGAPITTGGVSTGAVSFMHIFDYETEVIKRGGTGWGANMGVLRCDHPDIIEFVTAKSERKALRNFNISVGITDAFISLYHTDGILPLVDPHTKAVVSSVSARDLFARICQEAWKSGDPGLLFLDRINRDNPTPALGELAATNPCGEAPLLPFEACCLGGINVAKFFHPGTREFNWTDLRATAALALRMMDNVIEMSKYPLPEIDAGTRRNRKIGIGVMGFADLLVRMAIPYNSSEAEGLASDLMRNIQEATHDASMELAQTRGSFPAFSVSIWPERGFSRLRNATTTSNAPNSTISMIAGCSAGIEPIFALSYNKQLANGDQLTEVYPELVSVARAPRFYTDKLEQEIRASGSIQHIPWIPELVKKIFVTAHDISPEWHIRIQSAFQAHTDLGVSKTINLPHLATPKDIERAFLFAYDLGCKGITCYRDRCLDTQFLAVSSTTSDSYQSCPVCQ